jgi:predicted nucleic acid-binding protein
MSGKVFVDTNVLLRSFSQNMELHEQAKNLLFELVDADFEMWISRQIIREFLVQCTHPRTFPEPMPMDDVQKLLDEIQNNFHIADETATVTLQLLELLKTYPTRGKQIHDANIVASMLVNGVDTLLTMNITDFQRYKDRISLIPLHSSIM